MTLNAMKHHWIIRISLIAMVVFCCFQLTGYFQKVNRPPVVVFYDYDQVIDNTQIRPALVEKANEKLDPLNVEHDRLEERLKGMLSHLQEVLAPGSKQYEQYEREVQEARIERNAQKMLNEFELARLTFEAEELQWDEVNKAAKELALKQGYDCVMILRGRMRASYNIGGRPTPPIVYDSGRYSYLNPEFDITAELIEYINSRP